MTPDASFFLLLAGVAGGVLGGMGLGGGTLLIPLLTIGLGMNPELAAWLNLVTFVPMSVAALIVHSKNGLVSLKDALFLLIPALAGAVTGSLFLRGIGGKFGRNSFGWFLIALGSVSLFCALVKRLRGKE
ncbi:MAG: sulfite exporter TauE/SafE family protein [Clostridia bacterium]|nr:sulfite exporter TauE/SafE family protein [Clostridia bacterium]